MFFQSTLTYCNKRKNVEENDKIVLYVSLSANMQCYAMRHI